jgi:hypothetical protein
MLLLSIKMEIPRIIIIIIIINSLFQEGSKVNSKKLISPVALKKQYISTKVNIKLHIQDIA